MRTCLIQCNSFYGPTPVGGLVHYDLDSRIFCCLSVLMAFLWEVRVLWGGLMFPFLCLAIASLKEFRVFPAEANVKQ